MNFPNKIFLDTQISQVDCLFKLRSKWVDYIKYECEKAVQTGIPVFRPLWWHLDTSEAFSCSDQFFVGDKLLVAPVVCQGARTRDVFIPKGSWRDQTGKIVTGPIKLNVKAPLDVLPFYEKVSEEEACLQEPPIDIKLYRAKML
uniref:Glycosyl hydrolase family 31 C-terminal domain-containing protein n=1 Tax=Acrobeloides nanus TaxID=290746 RepID=A0A914D324_9BILA